MKKFLVLLLSCFITAMFVSCEYSRFQQTSDSGVSKATTTVTTDENGNTIEQKNIIERLKRDNSLGSVKHLYIISSYAGTVLEYSTVVGKVTSGGKRLSPKTVNGNGVNNSGSANFVVIGNNTYTTDEVLDDGGTYGESGGYMYWFDAQGNYHQYYPAGGTYVHISDTPLRIQRASITLSLE